MTQSEFTQRTQVAVSYEEFFAIHEVYAASDLDKDEFCKMWCKMNKSRVQAAKAERMIKAKEESYRNALYKFYERTSDIDMWTPICYVRMSAYLVQALSYAGIKMENECGSGLKNLCDIRHEVWNYLRH